MNEPTTRRDRIALITRASEAEKRVTELHSQVLNQSDTIGRLQTELLETRRALANVSQAALDQADGLADTLAQVTQAGHKARAQLRCLIDAAQKLLDLRAEVPSVANFAGWERRWHLAWVEFNEVIEVASALVK